jgi:murein DD-endopeptidase MepM/ murein hydrolase activator NlpD
MNWSRRRRVNTLIVSTAMLVMIGTVIAVLAVISNRRRSALITVHGNANHVSETQVAANELKSPSPIPESPTPMVSSMPTGKLVIPVAGVRPEQLQDTFTQARADGRVHDAIDIPAAKDTPVIATADGTIVKLFLSERGGTTIYQVSADGKFVYYYAHLDRYTDGLAEGHVAKQGETIAYVGDTGNAGAGNYHLHFSVAEISSPKDFWHGVNINPYPLLTR